MNTIDITGTIRINSGNISEFTREDHDSKISAITMEYHLPEGCSPEDVLFDPEQRALILSRSNSQLRVEIEDAVLVVSGPIKWYAHEHYDENNELAHHLKEVEQVLSALAQIGTHTELTLGNVRHVTYKFDRSLDPEEGLRDALDFWRVHLEIDKMYDLTEYGDDPVKVKCDKHFGFIGGDTELRFRWIPKNLSPRGLLTENGFEYSEVTPTALIRCEISCGGDALMKVLGLEGDLSPLQAAELSLDAFLAFLAPVFIPSALVGGKVLHLGALVDPWRLFLGAEPKD